MFCTIIEPHIRTPTRDSYDKSRVVSAQDQIQYQICNIHLTHPLRLPYLQRLPLAPVQTHHVAAEELTVSQAVTLATLIILTNHVPPCPANQDPEVQPPCTQPLLCQHQPRPIPVKTFMIPRYPCGREMGSLSTFSEVLLGTNQRRI